MQRKYLTPTIASYIIFAFIIGLSFALPDVQYPGMERYMTNEDALMLRNSQIPNHVIIGEKELKFAIPDYFYKGQVGNATEFYLGMQGNVTQYLRVTVNNHLIFESQNIDHFELTIPKEWIIEPLISIKITTPLWLVKSGHFSCYAYVDQITPLYKRIPYLLLGASLISSMFLIGIGILLYRKVLEVESEVSVEERNKGL